jgi:hypothetical protein
MPSVRDCSNALIESRISRDAEENEAPFMHTVDHPAVRHIFAVLCVDFFAGLRDLAVVSLSRFHRVGRTQSVTRIVGGYDNFCEVAPVVTDHEG